MDLFVQIYEKVFEMNRTTTLVKNQFEYCRQTFTCFGIDGMFEKSMLANTVSEIRTRILDSVIDLDVNRDLICADIFDSVMQTRVDSMLKGSWFSLAKEKKKRFYQVCVDKSSIKYGDFAIDALTLTDIVPDELPFSGMIFLL